MSNDLEVTRFYFNTICNYFEGFHFSHAEAVVTGLGYVRFLNPPFHRIAH